MRIKELDGIHVIELAAKIDVTSSPELEKLCNGLLDGGKNKIICDFSCTEYVSSMGLRVFLSTLKRSMKTGGKLILCCLKPGIMEIFDMTGLLGFFPSFDSTEAALAFFNHESSQSPKVTSENKHREIEEIIIDKKPEDITHAYLNMQKLGRMDEKA